MSPYGAHALGAEIRRRRLAADFSLRELSQYADIGKGRLSEIEHGSGTTVLTLVKIAQALGTRASVLLKAAGE